ncbi:hypothetical protein H7K45_18715 [Mycobacterium yunnanensis]|uniref:Uncharacterized protein n=1 Tax=Mycobacterium yunnanensis TaxID=368477 RepID=A0A9X2Z4Q6_9MYCO|nr:hypothetical protein [Mycobacterium yunnanensis]MCV7422581.1 hypothetical protein [Mycobacterium yunnanensis]
MSDVCRECREDLEHCHGTLVHHFRSTGSVFVECTEDCVMPDGLHSFSIDCEAVGCGCGGTIVATAAS